MGKRVLVFGSYVTDLCARTNRFPKPGETVKGNYFKLGPGGKGSNQAVAAHRAGANVTFITKLGNDTLGKQALDFYRAEKMSTEHILIDNELATGAALIAVNEETSQNQIIVIGGACENFTESDMPKILREVESADILLLQLEINAKPIRQVLKHAKKHGLLTVLNPAPAKILEKELYELVDIITPNETEAQVLTDIQVSNRHSAREAAQALLKKGVRKVVITLGEQGAFAGDEENERFYDIIPSGTVLDTTGAGDAFSGGLVAALAGGIDFFDAVTYSSIVAGISVTKHGTAPSMPHKAEIDRRFDEVKAR